MCVYVTYTMWFTRFGYKLCVAHIMQLASLMFDTLCKLTKQQEWGSVFGNQQLDNFAPRRKNKTKKSINTMLNSHMGSPLSHSNTRGLSHFSNSCLIHCDGCFKDVSVPKMLSEESGDEASQKLKPIKRGEAHSWNTQTTVQGRLFFFLAWPHFLPFTIFVTKTGLSCGTATKVTFTNTVIAKIIKYISVKCYT